MLPLLAVLFYLSQHGEEWVHLRKTVLPGYLKNTLILLLSVIALALVLGVPTAWFISAFNFPGRRFFSWALVLPLSIPSYVGAFVYYELVDGAIPLLIWIRTHHGVDAFFAAETGIRYGLLIILLSSVLTPYVFLGARAAFLLQGRELLEASRCLGACPRETFFRVALPLARPGIVAGAALVGMEVINDYGAVHFFGVPTLTEGIFRTWFGMGDKTSALRLAGIVMICVLVLLAVERLLRGRARYVTSETSPRPLARRELKRGSGWGVFLLCLVPLTLGFLYPVVQLILWAIPQLSSGTTPFPSVEAVLRGTGAALATAFVVTILASLFVYAVRLEQSKLRSSLEKVATLGYAIPGAVVAVGVMAVTGSFDRLQIPGIPIVGGTVAAIGFAYFVRFFAIPCQFSRSAFERIGEGVEESSRLLGRPPLATFLKIDLPLIRGSLAAAAVLLFVDLLKELPLTMILRPPNFETLATSAFSLAKEARLHACSVPSLLIVAIGGCGLILMNRWMMGGRHHE
ncbi:MAG: iron ABC transporter permease [Verrucomicrobiota bacterium]